MIALISPAQDNSTNYEELCGSVSETESVCTVEGHGNKASTIKKQRTRRERDDGQEKTVGGKVEEKGIRD